MSEIPIAGRDEAVGRGPGPWKEAPDPKNGASGMAKPLKNTSQNTARTQAARIVQGG